jgi:hypothetical protein
MNIQKNIEQFIEWLEFFYCLAEVRSYLNFNSKDTYNFLVGNFMKLLK